MKQHDMVIIGGGNTGLSAAYRVARASRRVALIDKGPVGGFCSLAGCNPKKVFVRASEVLETVRHAGEHGISTSEILLRHPWMESQRCANESQSPPVRLASSVELWTD